MAIISVHEVMRYTPKECFNGLNGYYHLKFDDGIEKKMHYKELIINRYFWEITTLFPGIAIVSSYDISNYYINGMFNTNTHNGMFNAMLKEMCLNYLIPKNIISPDVMDKIYRKMFETINIIYNEVVYNILDYVMSLDITDLLEIQLDPDLEEAMKLVEEHCDINSIQNAYDVLDKVMFKERYKDNPVAIAYLTKIVNQNQIKQVLGPRGYTTELDGSIFKYPITSSFTKGLKNIYDIATESRSAAKALYLSTEGIRQSEYFGRVLQLLVMQLKSITWEDCGNKDYILWYVRPKEYDDNGNMTYSGDLSRLVGKLYYDDEIGSEVYITEDMTDIEGTSIKLRSYINCKTPNKYNICHKCYGRIAYTIPKHTNIGHMNGVTLTGKISQSMLSSKHLTASATGSSILLDDTVSKFFIIKNSNQYALKTNLLNTKKNMKILISQDQCFGLKDIKKPSDITKVDPSRVTRIESFGLLVDDKDYYHINIKVAGTYGVFEPKFLAYIVNNNYTFDNKDRYVIDISKWVSPTGMIYIPEVEYSFFKFAKDVQSLVETRTPLKGNISKDTPESFLFKLFNLINSKLDINIAVLETIVYCLMVRDYPNFNLDLARNSKNPQLADIKSILAYRSLGAGYNHDELLNKMYNPRSFTNNNRPDHLMDVMVRPNEVVHDKFKDVFIKGVNYVADS